MPSLGLFKGDFLNQIKRQIKGQIKYLDSGLEFSQSKGHVEDPGSSLIQIKVKSSIWAKIVTNSKLYILRLNFLDY